MGRRVDNEGLPVEISEKLLCLFSSEVSAEEDRYVIEVPRQEVETGDIDPEDVYRVALISRDEDLESDGETVAQPRVRHPNHSHQSM